MINHRAKSNEILDKAKLVRPNDGFLELMEYRLNRAKSPSTMAKVVKEIDNYMKSDPCGHSSAHGAVMGIVDQLIAKYPDMARLKVWKRRLATCSVADNIPYCYKAYQYLKVIRTSLRNKNNQMLGSTPRKLVLKAEEQRIALAPPDLSIRCIPGSPWARNYAKVSESHGRGHELTYCTERVQESGLPNDPGYLAEVL